MQAEISEDSGDVAVMASLTQVGVFSEDILRERIVKIQLNKAKVNTLAYLVFGMLYRFQRRVSWYCRNATKENTTHQTGQWWVFILFKIKGQSYLKASHNGDPAI